MQEAMFSKFGRIAPSVKPAVLRHFYRDLTGDSTAANMMVEEEVDTRVKQCLEMESDDPQLFSTFVRFGVLRRRPNMRDFGLKQKSL